MTTRAKMPSTSVSILSLSPETLSRICYHLVDHEAAFNNLNRLAPVLTVCRALYRPAVAVVWNRLRFFDALLYTLPDSLCRMLGDEDELCQFVSIQ